METITDGGVLHKPGVIRRHTVRARPDDRSITNISPSNVISTTVAYSACHMANDPGDTDSSTHIRAHMSTVPFSFIPVLPPDVLEAV